MVFENSSFLTPSLMAKAVNWEEGKVILLDQTSLPKHERYVHCSSTEDLIQAIKRLVVRGAPAIGIAGAYGVVLAMQEVLPLKKEERWPELDRKLKALELARPTAVNLSWAIQQLKKLIPAPEFTLSSDLIDKLVLAAKKIHEDDIQANKSIAELGSNLLKEGSVLTICNTGALATGGVGTAFGILAQAHRLNKTRHVYACETRPILQGLRLTAWELNKQKIPFTVICDNMAAALMQKEKLSAVIAGADRVASNGDVANKIGTYALAVLAKAHDVPFYVAAPTSTFDLNLDSGAAIPIEQRDHEEILSVLGQNRPPFTVPVWNPAFDVTPQSLISAIVCERGVIHSPNREKIKGMLG